jgi:hypothetical protein
MEEVDELVLSGAPDADVLAALARRSPVKNGKENSVDEDIDRGAGCVAKSREYVSCVKIRGRPILPPVMTDELRYCYK